MHEEIDLKALDAWLAANVGGYAGPLQLEKFPGGQSNPTYKLLTHGKTYVMRTKPGPVAQLLPSAHAIEREYRVIQALASTTVPVPVLHGFCSDETVIGRAFYVMQHMAGRVFWNQALPELSPVERAAVYEEMNRTMAALHSVDLVAAGLESYGKPGRYVERQIDRWSRQYRATETDSIPAMDRLLEWLPANIPGSDETTIVHGDFRIDNLIFHPTEPRLLAVLDWELSTLGHPIADFAYHCMTFHLPPEPFCGVKGLDLKVLGIPAESDYLRHYCARTGRDHASVVRDWQFYIAFNFFKSGAIAQGITRRALDGVASHPDALAYGRRASHFAKAAWDIARHIDESRLAFTTQR